MLQSFQDNGLRFYTVNAAGAPIGLTWDDRPYSDQLQLNQRNRVGTCSFESVDFDDNISIIFWSDTPVILEVYDSNDVLLLGAIDDTTNFVLGSATAYFFDVDLSTIIGLDNGSYFIATNGADYLRSEPFYNTPNVLQFQYTNIYNDSITQNTYIPAILKEAGVNQLDKVFSTSANRFNRLVHSEKVTRTLESLAVPLYKINQSIRILKNDNLTLIQPTGSTFTIDPVRILEGGEVSVTQPSAAYNLYVLSTTLVYDDSLTFTVN